MLHEQGLDEHVCMKLQLLTEPGRPEALGPAGRRASSTRSTRSRSRMVGKYIDLPDSLQVAQRGAAPRRHPQPRAQGQHRVRRLRDARRRRTSAQLRDVRRDPGARRLRQARHRRQDRRRSQYARENRIPYLGICLGMQVADDRDSRATSAGLDGANSTEFDPDTPHPVIALIDRVAGPRRHDPEARRQLRPRRHDAPGRAELATSKPGTLAHADLRQAWSPSATATATRSTTLPRAPRRRPAS